MHVVDMRALLLALHHGRCLPNTCLMQGQTGVREAWAWICRKVSYGCVT